jgi:uncharacterized membrane protein YesL
MMARGGEPIMEMRGLMGGFYRISEWIMRFSVINVLWIICALPFFIMSVILMFSPIAQETEFDIVAMTWSITLPLIILAPFTIFPATAAMFAVARKWVMGETDVPLFKTFFKGYKENFRQSFVGGIIHMLIAALLGINYFFYSGRTDWLASLSIVFIILTVFWFVSLFHFFSVMTHFHMKLLQVIKNSLLLAVGRPITSILLLLSNAGIIYISFQYTFLVVFFMGSVMAFVSFWHFYRMFERVQSKLEEEKEKAAEEDEEELNEADPSVSDKR